MQTKFEKKLSKYNPQITFCKKYVHGVLKSFFGSLTIYGDSERDVIKDTILRSTINEYFENEPDGRLTDRVTKNATLVAKRYPSGRFTFLKF